MQRVVAYMDDLFFQMKLAETATKRVTDAVADIADVLTPAQRADLGQRVERWQRWFRG